MSNKKAKKIAYFITEDWVFITHRLGLAKAAINEGFQVYLITNISIFQNKIERENIRVFPVQFRRGSKNIFFDLLLILKLVFFLKKEKIDILHNVALKPIMYGSIAAKIANVPFVVNAITGRGSLFLKETILAKCVQRLFYWVLRACFSLNRGALIFQNRDDMAFFKQPLNAEVHSNRTHLIRGAGIELSDFNLFLSPNERPIVFVLMSRLIWHKGIQEFVDASKILKARGFVFKSLLVGKPDSENPAAIPESVLIQWNKEKNINWQGYISNPNIVYQNAHIAVLPSYGEGLPKSLLEAAACGKPIIATNVPGCREVVIDGENGFLVKEKSSLELADKMEFFLKNPERIIDMGIKSRDLVTLNFSSTYVYSKTIEVYKRLV